MKYILKKFLVPVLSSRPVSALANRLVGRGVPVFMLHRMIPAGGNGGTHAEHLRRCLGYLVEHRYTPVSLEDVVTALRNREPLPPGAVVFTMDDGYADQAEIAVPIFREFGVPLTIFLITGMIDRLLWPCDSQIAWIMENTQVSRIEAVIDGCTLAFTPGDDLSRCMAKRTLLDAIREIDAEQVPGIMEQVADAAGVTVPEAIPDAYRPLDWDTARRLEQAGVCFAPHSVTHHVLSRLGSESMENEIRASWETLERELEQPLKIFCYPAGRDIDYGEREIEALANCGYLAAVSSTPGFLEPAVDPRDLFRLPRFPLPNSMEDFIQYCTWIEYAKGDYRAGANGSS